MKESTPMIKLMDAYCCRLGLETTQVRFTVAGITILPEFTPKALEIIMQDDTLEVFLEAG